MMNTTVSFLLSILLSSAAIAQDSFSISGKIKETPTIPLPYADVQIKSTDGSNVEVGGITQEDGSFQFDLPNGKYSIHMSFAGFYADSLETEIKGEPVTIGSVLLRPEATQLDAIQFTVTKSQMELKIDKRVYNVGTDLTAQGTTASEMLENIPSVAVDAEGNVSLRGSQGVRILIDGKYSGFASSGDALKSLQSDRIEKVEIITNASSRYDAEGEGGIINIVLKKNNKGGLNGAVNLRTGYYPEVGGGFNFNYRKNKLNVQFQYNINRDESPANSTTFQRLANDDTSFTYRQLYSHNRKKFRNDGMIGLEYDFTDRTTVSASANFKSGLGNNVYDREYQNLDEQNILTQADFRKELNTEFEDLLETTLGIRHKLAKKGGEWNTEFKHFTDKDFERSNYTNTNDITNDLNLERSHAYVTEKFYLMQSDFIYPVFENGKLETGVRSQWRIFHNDFGFSRQIGTSWSEVPQFNDEFEYNENVTAAYLMGSNTFGKFGAQMGVRAEYTDISTLQQSQNITQNKNYLNFFPSAAFSYALSESTNLQLSYSKRIRRPGQWDLMPFMKFGDNREMRIGNPDINPEYTHAIDAGWMQYFKGGSLLSSVYYRKTLDKIERIAIAGPDAIIYRIAMNVAEREAMGFEFNGNYSFTSWLRFNTGFNLFREVISGAYNGQSFDASNYTWTNRTSINITLPKKIRLQVSSNYQAPSVRPQGKTLAIFFGDIAATKDFWKNNATIGINVRDVLNSRRWRSITDTETIYAISNTQWRPRSIRLTFTYRFNQAKKEGKDVFDAMPSMEE